MMITIKGEQLRMTRFVILSSKNLIIVLRKTYRPLLKQAAQSVLTEQCYKSQHKKSTVCISQWQTIFKF